MTEDFDLEKEVDGDLIYDRSVFSIIKKKFPSAIFEDASDIMRENRIFVSIPGVSYMEYFVYAMEEGFSSLSFTFELLFLDGKNNMFNELVEKFLKNNPR